MEYLIAAHSDAGERTGVNQDSLVVRTADTEFGKVCFAAVCDGIGGLEKGEVASAAVARAASDWFERDFPEILYGGMNENILRETWEKLAVMMNQRLADFGKSHHIRLGTTIAALLLLQNHYYIWNVGDSRVYLLANEISQLTKDQTVAQYQADQGKGLPDAANKNAGHHILLQCIGASSKVIPDFTGGQFPVPCSFLLCSDGFRNRVRAQEIQAFLKPSVCFEENRMARQLMRITKISRQRGETDNISAALIHICR